MWCFFTENICFPKLKLGWRNLADTRRDLRLTLLFKNNKRPCWHYGWHPRPDQGYVSTCTERLRDGLGTATADGCRPRLFVSTRILRGSIADPPWLNRKRNFTPLVSSPAKVSHRIASNRIASHRIVAQRSASHLISSHRIASQRSAAQRFSSHLISSHLI